MVDFIQVIIQCLDSVSVEERAVGMCALVSWSVRIAAGIICVIKHYSWNGYI